MFLEFKNSQINRKTIVSPLKHFRGRDRFCAQRLMLACRRLVLPPALDPLLCGKSSGLVNYRDPSASAAHGGGGFDDPDTCLSGFEGAYVLVPRGRCSFESKARSAPSWVSTRRFAFLESLSFSLWASFFSCDILRRCRRFFSAAGLAGFLACFLSVYFAKNQ